MLTQLTATLTMLITNLYISTGLLGIAVAMAIESCLIPLPSEIVMPVAGIIIQQHKILANTNPFLSLLVVAIAGSVGGLAGSLVAYGIGYAGGRPLVLKYGRYLLISQRDAVRADIFFARWGSATTFFSRLLPVIRTYISLPAGITRMSLVKFSVYTFLGSLPWCFALAYMGYILGNHLAAISSVFHGLDVVVLLVFAALVAFYIYHHTRPEKEISSLST
jgi:membrane protein DedA with SNARE-associated domain